MIETQATKYLQLFWRIALTVITGVVVIAGLMLLLRWIFGLFGGLPIAGFIYLACIVALPAIFFICIYLIYFRRTRRHPSQTVKFISKFLFIAAIAAWVGVFVIDIIAFIKHTYPEAAMYYSYDTLFLAGNVTMLFLTAVMQALTMEKEKDWRERRKDELL